MSAILIIAAVLAFVASFAILRTKRSRSNEDADALPPHFGARGLFEEDAARRLGPADEGESKASRDSSAKLLERASRGDAGALAEARDSRDPKLYARVLDSLTEQARGDSARLRALAESVAKGGDLRSGARLSYALLEEWERSPSRAYVPTVLRVAALSDDAAAFERAVSSVARALLEGRLEGADAEGLRALFDAEYWLLSSEARRSGAGFRLKQKLSQVRRRMSDHARRGPMPLGERPYAGAPEQKERQ